MKSAFARESQIWATIWAKFGPMLPTTALLSTRRPHPVARAAQVRGHLPGGEAAGVVVVATAAVESGHLVARHLARRPRVGS